MIKKGECRIYGPCKRQEECCPGYECYGDPEWFTWCAMVLTHDLPADFNKETEWFVKKYEQPRRNRIKKENEEEAKR